MTTTTASATQSLFATLGTGSGVDMTALAENLAAAQFANRTDRLTAKSDTLDRRISTASNLKSMLLSLASSLGDRVRTGDLSPQPSLANPAVASASLSGTRPPSGTYSLEVTALAAGQVLAAPAVASASDPAGAGTLTLRFGTVSGGSFTEDAGHAPVAVTIASGASLTDVAAAINGARAGVSAYIAQTPEGARLVLKGSEGAANGFVLDASEAPGEPGLAALAWSPAAAPERLLAGATDAALSIDGLAVTARSNTVADAIPGVTLKLAATNAGAPTRVSFSDPGTAIRSAMADLTAALNEVAGQLRTATDPISGDLARDVGARGLRRSFGQLAGKDLMPGAATGAPHSLADLGLSTQRDGTFQLDTRRLEATLRADPQGAAAMFTNGIRGVFAEIDSLSRAAARTGDAGSLAGSVARYSSQKTQVSTDLSDLAADQEKLRAQLVKRFAATDAIVGASRSTLTFLSNQIDAWNAQKN